MRKFLNKKVIAVLAAAIVVALISIVTLTANPGGSDVFSAIGNTLSRPVKSMMTSLVSSLERIYGYMYEYDRIVDENEQLKARVAELEEEYRDYTAVSQENERLKQLLGFTSTHSGMENEPATIISWNASNWSSKFTIGKGSNSGIELGDCVITENGYLVGQVTELGPTTATITTILDTSSSIGALVYSSSEVAVIEGDYKLSQQNKVKLAYLPDDATIATGDTIITSGMGGNFPQGLVIGYVSDVYQTGSGLADYAAVEPAADIAGLTNVYIVTEYETN